MTHTGFKSQFARYAGLTRLPGLAEGAKDEAYREGMAAGQAVSHAVQMGWAKTPKDGDKAGWMKIVDKYAGVQEFAKDPAWMQGFKSALTGYYGKAVKMESSDQEVAKTIIQQMGGRLKAMLGATLMSSPDSLTIKWPNKKRSLGNVCRITLRPDDTYDMEFFNGAKSVKKFEGLYAEDLKRTFEDHTGWRVTLEGRKPSVEEDDKEHIINVLLAGYDAKGAEGLKEAAYKLEAKGVSKPMLSSLLRAMTRTGKLGGESVELTDREKWLIDQYANDIREAKGFHHGTVRQWKNGRHMKNGGAWERLRTGRPAQMASKVPSFADAVPGSIPAGVWEDPNDFSRQAVPTRDMSAAIVNAVAGREVFAVGEALELYARVLDGETLDEGAVEKLKMVFGKLLKVGAKPKAPPAQKHGILAIDPLKKAREAEARRRANKARSIERGER